MKHFTKYPSSINASSDIPNIPSWLAEDDYEVLMDRVYDYMFSYFDDAKYFLRDYKSGDTSEAAAGTGGPSNTFDLVIYSADTWETMPKYMDYVRDRIQDSSSASDWFKKEIEEVFEENAPDYPGAVEWLNILKDHGTY